MGAYTDDPATHHVAIPVGIIDQTAVVDKSARAPEATAGTPPRNDPGARAGAAQVRSGNASIARRAKLTESESLNT
jgi:hypothetical protein